MTVTMSTAPAKRPARFSAYELSVFAVVAALLLLALIGPLIAPASIYTSDMVMTLMPPSADNWLGTDDQGRDIFWRLIAGSRLSVQAQVINLLQDMQGQLNLGILFVAHDLAVVRHLCTSVAVLEKGRVVEHGTREQVFDSPQHPYTKALLEAVPIPDPTVGRARRAERQAVS